MRLRNPYHDPGGYRGGRKFLVTRPGGLHALFNPRRSCRARCLPRLQRCGFSGPDAQGKLQLLGQDAVLSFFAREYPKLEHEWSVSSR